MLIIGFVEIGVQIVTLLFRLGLLAALLLFLLLLFVLLATDLLRPVFILTVDVLEHLENVPFLSWPRFWVDFIMRLTMIIEEAIIMRNGMRTFIDRSMCTQTL